jgi:NO-binding membrane sensor protein with MHYT domain
MDNAASLFSSEPSITLWLAAAMVAAVGMRAFLECLRRVGHEGPLVGWRDLVFAATAVQVCVWSTALLGISSQGLHYAIGYHPLPLFGTLAIAIVASGALLFWSTFKRSTVNVLAAAAGLGVVALGVQVGVVSSLGLEPGIRWRPDLMVFALLVLVIGHGVAIYLVLSAARGAKTDRGWRRTMAALLGAIALVGAQELSLMAAAMQEQSISGYSRHLPEVALMLLAGGAVPVIFLVLIVDQYMQRRIRRASRRKRHRLSYSSEPGTPTTFSGDLSPTTTRAAELPPSTR